MLGLAVSLKAELLLFLCLEERKPPNVRCEGGTSNVGDGGPFSDSDPAALEVSPSGVSLLFLSR